MGWFLCPNIIIKMDGAQVDSGKLCYCGQSVTVISLLLYILNVHVCTIQCL